MFLRRKQNQRHPEDDASQRETKVKELRDEIGPLLGRSLKFCVDACLRRYLVARNWKVEKAKKMEINLQHEVAHEGETGKVSRVDFFDRIGRTVLILRPGKQNMTSAEGTIRHLVYLIENGILRWKRRWWATY